MLSCIVVAHEMYGDVWIFIAWPTLYDQLQCHVRKFSINKS